MGLYFVALFAIVVLALALLTAVALAAAARRGNDQTRMSRRLITLVDHLNGEAPPPQFLVDIFTRDEPAVAAPRPAPTEAQPVAKADSVPEPAPVAVSTAPTSGRVAA